MTEARKEVILDFINRRFQIDCNWCNGNCYWFARILCDRFSELEIYYCPVMGHFIAGAGDSFFDWHGNFYPTDKDRPILFSQLREDDALWYDRLYRDCVR